MWVEGEKIMSAEPPEVVEARNDNSHGTNFVDSPEPIYGTQFLPRKFKIAVTVPTDNSVDILTNDIGVVVVSDANGEPQGFNLYTKQPPIFERKRADPKNVMSIILGGGAGAELFPLTSRTATPAVSVGGCYKLIDIPMSNCINSGINKVYILTQFNSASLNRHIHRTYYGHGINFGDGFVEVLAATQTPGEAGKQWFQGTADAVRQFMWLFEDARTKDVDNILILSGDHLYRMDFMEFVQNHIDRNADITVSCVPVAEKVRKASGDG